MAETPPAAPEQAPPESDNGEPTSIFIPADALEGRNVKAGDELTLTVKAVDPDSGEVEAVCDYGSETEKPSSEDKAMDEHNIPED